MNKSSSSTPNRWRRFQEKSNGMMAAGYVSPYKDVEAQPRDREFIPLNTSTPEYRRNEGNRFASPFNRGHYYAKAKAHCNNSMSPYKHVAMQAHRQKKNYHRGPRRYVNISDYIDIKSILEDPWAELEKKLDQSRITDQTSTSYSSSFFSNFEENKNFQSSTDNQSIEIEKGSLCIDKNNSREMKQYNHTFLQKTEQNVAIDI